MNNFIYEIQIETYTVMSLIFYALLYIYRLQQTSHNFLKQMSKIHQNKNYCIETHLQEIWSIKTFFFLKREIIYFNVQANQDVSIFTRDC